MKTLEDQSDHVELEITERQSSNSPNIPPAEQETNEFESVSPAEGRRIIRKIDFRVIPILSLLYL